MMRNWVNTFRNQGLKKALANGDMKALAAVRMGASPAQLTAHAHFITENAAAMLLNPTQYNLKAYRTAAHGNREMETALAHEIERIIPVLLQGKAYARLDQIVRDCEGNKTLQAAIKPEVAEFTKTIRHKPQTVTTHGLKVPEPLPPKPQVVTIRLTEEDIAKLAPGKRPAREQQILSIERPKGTAFQDKQPQPQDIFPDTRLEFPNLIFEGTQLPPSEPLNLNPKPVDLNFNQFKIAFPEAETQNAPPTKPTAETVKKPIAQTPAQKPLKLSRWDRWNPLSEYNVARRALAKGTLARLKDESSEKQKLIYRTLFKEKTPAMLMSRKKYMLKAWRNIVRNNKELEDALQGAMRPVVSKIIESGNIKRLSEIMRDCKGNAILQQCVNPWTVRDYAQSLLSKKSLTAYGELKKAFEDHKKVYQESCRNFEEYDAKYNIACISGGTNKDDVYVMVGRHEVICEEGKKRVTPKELVQIWSHTKPPATPIERLVQLWNIRTQNPATQFRDSQSIFKKAELLRETLEKASQDPASPKAKVAKDALEELRNVMPLPITRCVKAKKRNATVMLPEDAAYQEMLELRQIEKEEKIPKAPVKKAPAAAKAEQTAVEELNFAA